MSHYTQLSTSVTEQLKKIARAITGKQLNSNKSYELILDNGQPVSVFINVYRLETGTLGYYNHKDRLIFISYDKIMGKLGFPYYVENKEQDKFRSTLMDIQEDIQATNNIKEKNKLIKEYNEIRKTTDELPVYVKVAGFYQYDPIVAFKKVYSILYHEAVHAQDESIGEYSHDADYLDRPQEKLAFWSQFVEAIRSEAAERGLDNLPDEHATESEIYVILNSEILRTSQFVEYWHTNQDFKQMIVEEYRKAIRQLRHEEDESREVQLNPFREDCYR